MSKLLNNKWIVIALGCLAVVVVYKRVITPILHASQAPSNELASIDDGLGDVERTELPRNGIDPDFQLVSAQYNLERIDTADVRWNNAPSRDPFTPQATLERKDIAAIQTKADKSPVRKTVQPVKRVKHSLSAIVNSSSKSFAVIDGNIVQRGDRVGAYRVRDIHETDVGLTNVVTGQIVQLEVKK